MSKIKVSLDNVEYWEKPQGKDIARIHNQLGSSVKEINPTQADINQFTLDVGRDGHTFCTATFRDGKRSKDNFEQQQMFALDFDNKAPDRSVSFEDVKARAKKYNLPILFAYDTFSSTNHDKFRVIFLNDVAIPHKEARRSYATCLGDDFSRG